LLLIDRVQRTWWQFLFPENRAVTNKLSNGGMATPKHGHANLPAMLHDIRHVCLGQAFSGVLTSATATGRAANVTTAGQPTGGTAEVTERILLCLDLLVDLGCFGLGRTRNGLGLDR
jgi:hypothetical protein